ncbi:MAG TPA: type II secretion system protein [Thermoanaerobaculia bacterium]|nr:type II secretion system protein [Thermoanaerobaculia bacterium]
MPGRARGYTLVELVAVCAVLVILAAVALPTTRYTRLRLQEMELRSALREMRSAIDEHKRYSDAGLIPVEFGSDGYPGELEVLVEGIEVIGQIDKKIRFLRRIPVDPMTGEAEWGLRSYEDEPDSTSWGGENVFDVYSLSGGVGLNGVPYSEW